MRHLARDVGTVAHVEDRLARYVVAGVHATMLFAVAVPSEDYRRDCGRTIEALATA